MSRDAVIAVVMTFVAINTLLFLGLAVAKVIPWPAPLDPRMLRARAGIDADAPPRVTTTGRAVPRTAREATLDIVRGFLTLGIVLIVAGILSAFADSAQRTMGGLILTAAGACLLIAAGATYPASLGMPQLSTIWCAAVVIVAIALAVAATLQPTGPPFLATIVVLSATGAVRLPRWEFLITMAFLASAALVALTMRDNAQVMVGVGAIAFALVSATTLRLSRGPGARAMPAGRPAQK